MNSILCDFFFDLRDDHAFKLAQSSNVFTNLFLSDSFWLQKAKKMGINSQDDGKMIRNDIRKLNNLKSLPDHVFCTHFTSPHHSWDIVDMSISFEMVRTLFQTENGFTESIFISEDRGRLDLLYEGMIPKVGEAEKQTIEDRMDYFGMEHPRAYKKLELHRMITWNINAIHFQDYLIEKEWPYQVINWKLNTFEENIQEKLQQIGHEKKISHFYIQHECISVIYCDSQTVTMRLWENQKVLERSIDVILPGHDVFYVHTIKAWCFK